MPSFSCLLSEKRSCKVIKIQRQLFELQLNTSGIFSCRNCYEMVGKIICGYVDAGNCIIRPLVPGFAAGFATVASVGT